MPATVRFALYIAGQCTAVLVDAGRVQAVVKLVEQPHQLRLSVLDLQQRFGKRPQPARLHLHFPGQSPQPADQPQRQQHIPAAERHDRVLLRRPVGRIQPGPDADQDPQGERERDPPWRHRGGHRSECLDALADPDAEENADRRADDGECG